MYRYGFLSASVLALATPVHAQEMQDIIVTAQKRSENIQKVPIAIDAIAGDALAERGVRDPGDMIKLFPGVTAKTGSSINNGISIRGVGTQNFHVTAQPAVGQYVDEISLATPFTSQLGLFDMERVEVLRGPQNTLFGRNTTGGAINYITRKPKVGEQFNGYAKINVGNLDRIDFETAVGAPIGDTLAVRAAFQTQNRDGAFTNLVDGKKVGSTERYAGRVSLAWEPEPDTQVLLSGHVGYNRGTRVPRKSVGLYLSDGVTPCPATFTGVDQFRGLNNCVAPTKSGQVNPSTEKWRQVYDVQNTRTDVDYEGGLLRINHDFERVSLTSITGYDVTKVKYWDPAGGLPVLAFGVGQDAKYKSFSQEVRLSSDDSGRLKWLLGGFYAHEDDSLGTVVRNNSIGTPPPGVVPSVLLDQKVNIWSIYGQADYKITDKLSLTAGLRWTHDKKNAERTLYNYFATDNGLLTGNPLPSDTFLSIAHAQAVTSGTGNVCFVNAPPCSLGPVSLSQSLSEFGGKIGLNYQFTDDILGYVSYSRGFKSGAFDVRALAIAAGAADQPVGPEKLDSYEVGLKTQLFDRRVQLNGAVFYYDWFGLQAFATSTSLGPAFVNVPKTRIYGADLDSRFNFGAGWSLQAGGAYLNSKIVDTGGLLGVGENRLPNSPKWSFNGSISKKSDLGFGDLTVQASYRYTSEQTGTLDDRPTSRINPASFVDASAKMELGASRQFELTAWVENLFGTKTCGLIQDLAGLTNSNQCGPNEGMALYGLTGAFHF